MGTENNNLKWYKFEQNNSGGFFVVNDKLCHRLFIQAENEYMAIKKAEELGCYWYGVDDGIDCPCCGDRWSNYWIDPVNIEDIPKKEHSVTGYSISNWYKRFGSYNIIEEPKKNWIYGDCYLYDGKISFTCFEEYLQYLADEYGMTTPDIRLFYANGEVKEIYSNKENLKYDW